MYRGLVFRVGIGPQVFGDFSFMRLVGLKLSVLHVVQDEMFCACRFSQINDKDVVLYTAAVTGIARTLQRADFLYIIIFMS